MKAKQAARFAEVVLDEHQVPFIFIELADVDMTLIIGAFEDRGCKVERDGQKLTITRQKPD